MRKIFPFIAVLILLILSCTSNKTSIEEILLLAGKNKSELEKVLDYYSQNPSDSLKYKAACFLIENMTQYSYYSQFEQLYPVMDSLYQNNTDLLKIYTKFDSIKKNINISKPLIYPDITTISSDFLILHIDKMFEVWENSPWKPKIKFDNFCEFILPYSVSIEKRDLWIDYYRTKYTPFLLAYLNSSDSVSLIGFCEELNSKLIEMNRIKIYHEGLSNYPPLMVDNIRSGFCDDYVARSIFIMRSLGMPIGVDFSPQWNSYDRAHSWNVILDEEGNFHPFSGFDETIKQWHIESSFSCAKVFRKTYSKQKESLAILNIEKSLPTFFNESNFYDVSAEYFPVSDIDIELETTTNINNKVAYLCVFNNKEWIPVHWGHVINNKVRFTNMGRKNVYLPAYYFKGKLVPAANPFVLNSDGTYYALEAHPTKMETMFLSRKYHLERVNRYIKRMVGGVFQGSNDPLFSQAETLYTIESVPDITFNAINIKSNNKYRYVRYIGADSSFTNVAEIEFYQNNKKLIGNIIGTEGSLEVHKPNRTKEAVFDEDILTFFDAPKEKGAWVGLDLKKPSRITEIRFMPRNDDNSVRIGDEYELCYWKSGRWKSLGIKTADKLYLEYNNCPLGALYLLHNHTRGKEERIFTFDKGKQIWW